MATTVGSSEEKKNAASTFSAEFYRSVGAGTGAFGFLATRGGSGPGRSPEAFRASYGYQFFPHCSAQGRLEPAATPGDTFE